MKFTGNKEVLISRDTSCSEEVGYETDVEVPELKSEDEHTLSSKVLEEAEGLVDSTPTPKDGMTFNSLECAKEYYNKYAFQSATG
ncbi:hypothetical protein Syun_001761 [Stephania yunnanensis]|uniref:Uncharacterized protein n=1 Tax=Stephania yunnanensis TaxID=152371 RepID=A0AAP0LEQ9_9MAGN